MRALGIALHTFKKETCSKFNTKELPKEAVTQQTRQVKLVAKQSSFAKAVKRNEKEVGSTAKSKTGKGKEKEAEPTAKSNAKPSWQPKDFNLNTYKLHSLGDYANTIRQYGMTDSYSTQLVHGAQVFAKQIKNDWSILRVKHAIVIPRFLIHALAKRNSRSSLPRSKEGGQGSAISGKTFWINQPKLQLLPRNALNGPLLSPT